MTQHPTITRLVAAWNKVSVDDIAACYADDTTLVHPMVPAPLRGRGAVKDFEGGMFSAFTDIDWQATRVIERGDELCLEFVVRAKNTKPLPTPKGLVPATNRSVTVHGASVLKLNAKGEIAEERRYFDTGAMFVELGLA